VAIYSKIVKFCPWYMYMLLRLFCVSGTCLEWHFLQRQNQYMHLLWDNGFSYFILPEHSTVKPTSFCWTSVPRWIQIVSGIYKHTYTVKPLYNDHVYSQPRVTKCTLNWIWCWKKPKRYRIVTFVWNTPSLYQFLI